MKHFRVVVCVLFVCLSASALAQSPPPFLSFQPGTVGVIVFSPGQPIQVTAVISNAPNLKSGNFTIEYEGNRSQSNFLTLNTTAKAPSLLSNNFTAVAGFDPVTGLNTENVTFTVTSPTTPGTINLADFTFSTTFNIFNLNPGDPNFIRFGANNTFNIGGTPTSVFGSPIGVALPMPATPEPGVGAFAIAALLGGLFTWKMRHRTAKSSRAARS